MHLKGLHPRSPARASQSQVQAGASAVIDNCVRNQERPLGGAATHISERCITLIESGILTIVRR